MRKVGLAPPHNNLPNDDEINAKTKSSPDEGMQCISVGDPANQPRVGREGYDSVSGNAEIPLGGGPVIGQHTVD